ncbi:TonB-dependent receptor [Shewanella aestuarii]|uniref:TonB-dependent receptor n=1 Tax=Shewanella aestuarii TaxID=1028752 RepID=A0A6G9QK93_9GAMM|nr:TonB-dependent receptor [Shewanella aestuarii]QIR14485.1 TonB-dependent receptor [Shewanella aestuarii]
MIQRTLLATSIKTALIASVAVSSSVSMSAFAAEETAKVERIEVTGSRIKRADMETASPVTVIGEAEIRAEGYTSVDQLLQAQTSMAGAALGATSNNGSDGVAQVDLRGMGSQRTLVLLNGRRMVNSGSGADSAVDLNTIPVAMISRVEILKDGASAVYGSDAIAGVVNIITKKDFEGFQLDLNGSTTSESDGENVELSALYGFNTDTGNYTIGVSYTERKGVIQGDRDWTIGGGSSIIPEGTLGGKQWLTDEETGESSWGDRQYGYDYTQDSYYQTPNKRYSLFLNAIEEFRNDITLNADFIYTKRESHQMMAAQPANLMLDVCGEPGVDPVNCMTLDQSMIDAGIKADDRGRVNFRKRMNDVGNRVYEQDTDTIRASVGLTGDLDIHTGFVWDVAYTFGYNRADTWVHNSIHAGRMIQSIYENQDAWFYGGNITPEMADAVSYVETTTGGNDQHTISANLSGELFDLDAGAVGFAIGAEYRYEKGFYNPDPVIVAGEGTAAQQDPTAGDYNVFSIYQEISIPFTESLTGEFALRYDDYSTFGKATTWKVGLTYEATDDLMLRGVAATGFRAPSISELFGGNSGSYDYLTDPWGNEQDAQILVNYTSDENLKPEESESLTLGLVYSPSYVDGLSLTVDYWSFEVTDAIARLDVQKGLNDCFAGDQVSCELFNIGPNGNLENLTNSLTNVGSQDTSGVDINVAYTFEALGLDWRINNDTTYLIEFVQDGVDYTGEVDGMFGAYAEWRNNFSVQLGTDTWNVVYFNRYISGMNDVYDDYATGEEVTDKVDSMLYHNISANYFVSDVTSLTLGIKNLTDEKPHYVSNGSDGGTSPEVYDTIGRQFYAGVSIKF